MPINNTNHITLQDVARSSGSDMANEVVNTLTQVNPILQDALALPCNKGTYHETTYKTKLPNVSWGRYNKGTPTSKSENQMIKDTPGWLETATEVDRRLIDGYEKDADKASYLREEGMANIEAMGQEAARALIYEDNMANPERIIGLHPRLDSLSGENNLQIIDGGGTGSNLSSIWMVTWHKQGAHLIYPKSRSAGIKAIPRANTFITDADGNKIFTYRVDYEWHLGLVVRDWRYVARIANIPLNIKRGTIGDSGAQLQGFQTGVGGHDLITMLDDMYYAHEGRRMNMGKTCIYCNPSVHKILRSQARNIQQNSFFSWTEVASNAPAQLMFQGIPVKEMDAIHFAETRIT